jgi:NADPH:quinone reductase-like Zn-dependent oxidoreductase
MISTEAWTISPGPEANGPSPAGMAELKREMYSFPDVTESEVLAEPIYGCWEGNMTHAILRDPVDVCRQRREEKVVLGNAGVVRVLRTGARVETVQEGNLCIVFCNGVWDKGGYPRQIYAYDAPGTVGLLARRVKLHERQLLRIPEQTRHSLPQWAAFSLRYVTAWANWKVAYGCWRLVTSEGRRAPIVWGWGGGVTLAEVTLAKLTGCQVAMIASSDERLRLLGQLGITPIDRRPFRGLHFDRDRYRNDLVFRTAYQEAEQRFLQAVGLATDGAGVSIFVDFIGQPVYRATLKAISCPGVITTAGWRAGMKVSNVRALECMNWHIHVHTHYARYAEAQEALCYAEDRGWMPVVGAQIYGWDQIPELARDHAQDKISSYFPIFQVNRL